MDLTTISSSQETRATSLVNRLMTNSKRFESFEALKNGSISTRKEVIHQLEMFGFSLLSIENPDLVHGLQSGLSAAEALKSFRFPPINVSEVKYDQPERDAFRSLYTIAVSTLAALQGDRSHLEAPESELFSASPDEPLDPSHPLSATFFNLFNYDHGALNAHQDRGLVTIICVAPPEENTDRSSLWIKGADELWRSADESVFSVSRSLQNPQDQMLVILLVGEQGEILLRDKYPQLFAAEHCVRVRPEGPFIERSHHVPDPESLTSGNRISTALILRAATE